MIRPEITATEFADRIAIRELVDAYARCADRRDAKGQRSFFAEDTRFVVYLAGEGSEPTQVFDGRERWRRVQRPQPLSGDDALHSDRFAKVNGAWLFAERNLYLDWAETRPSHA